ncbi:DUF4837 family protein [Sungkyunkwania multivorans]|uniref:DUF4837 family protein n=1 Tax=Sungkyunkwania multivorans TaxID=1173618 RepID=A0ABW3D206_9FLAO
MRSIFVILFTGLLAISCNDGKKEAGAYLPKSYGMINHVLVVTDNDKWNGQVGDAIREIFAAEFIGVLNPEPIYTLRHLEPKAFSGTVTKHRNILIVENGESNFDIKDNVYAKHQKLIKVSGGTDEEIIENLKENAEKGITNLKANEMKEKQQMILLSPNQQKDLEEKFGITLQMPSVYKTVRNEDKFLWIERPTSNGTMNLLVYELPAGFIAKDSTMVTEFVKLRDSIGKNFVPGRLKDSYMITEAAFAPFINDDIIDNKPATEIRGRWELEGNFMAGPFVNYIIEDKENERQIVVEGFVFAPQKDKRDQLFELEAIIRSLNVK